MPVPAPELLLPAVWTLLFLAVGVFGWLYGRQHSRSRRLSQALDAAQSELGSLLTRDAVTGLATRAEFEATLDVAVRDCDHQQRALCVLVLGLDGFRQVNEACGHEAGDQALQQLGARLATAAESCVVARLAGDEFVLLAPLPLAEARALALRLVDVARRELNVAGQSISLSASIGIASYPVHGSKPFLIGNASAAMRAVKQAGGGSFAEFEASMGVDQREQFALRNELRLALERHQFQLVYQPKVDAESLQITAAEALLRWNHPQRGVVSPTVFIPVAERHGLIAAIGNWVIEEACRQAAEWREQGLRMRVAVNLSGAQVRQDDLVPRIESALRRHQLQPTRFTCEITESVAMEDTRATQLFFQRLGRAGVHVSIDDFGTGYSSLASLRKLPAAELKIDRAFVADIEHSADALSIAAAIVQMAHQLELRVVAEGVETKRQRDILRHIGCDELQGFLFAKPMSAQALALWAADDRPESQRAFRDSLFEETTAGALR